jgi:hypothetical protein
MTLQDCIDYAVRTGDIVHIKSALPNDQLRAQVTDYKSCYATKPTKESTEITIRPPTAPRYNFETDNLDNAGAVEKHTTLTIG